MSTVSLPTCLCTALDAVTRSLNIACINVRGDFFDGLLQLYHGFWVAATNLYRRLARGGHALPKVSLGPTMPYPFTPCRRPPLKRPYGCFMSDCPQGGRPAAIFYSLGYSTPYALCLKMNFSLSLFKKSLSCGYQKRMKFQV
jgi:hypothetical protein